MIAKKEWFCICLMVVAALPFCYLMRDYDDSSILFPRVMVIVMFCLAVLKAIGEFIARNRARLAEEERKAPYPWFRVLFVLAAMVAYIWVLEDLGFYTSAFLFFFLVTLAIQPFKITPKGVAVRFAHCFGFILFLYLLFSVLLKVQLPKGILV
jgi:hypothetical protein